jgi:hypothetical protein
MPLKPTPQQNGNPCLPVTLILLCMLSLFSNSLSAQKGFDAGVNVGFQTNTLINKLDQAAGPELDFKQKIGVPLGISIGYTFDKHFGAGLDIIYAHQGQSYFGQVLPATDTNVYIYHIKRLAAMNSVPLTGTYTANVALTCIKFPLMLRYTGDKSKTIWFNSFIGPQFNMLSSATFHLNEQEKELTGMNIKSKDVYNTVTIDAVLGLGAGFNLSANLMLTASLRLEYGLSDIEKKSATFKYTGGAEQTFYSDGRTPTHSASGGLLLALSYKFMKEEKKPVKAKAKIAPAKPKTNLNETERAPMRGEIK